MCVFDTVKVLQTISDKLTHVNWKVAQTSCNNGDDGFNIASRSSDLNVTCDCTFQNSTVCHVTHMYALFPFPQITHTRTHFGEIDKML